MGRRPGDPEGGRSGLVEDHPGDVAKFAADFVDQRCACSGMGDRAVLTLDQQGFEPGGGGADQAAGAAIETALATIRR